MDFKNLNETQKTILFGGAAIVLALLAFVTAPSPVTPDAFLDQGEAFFPEFTDPNSATTLEVIEYNEETGEAIPFKVTNQNGRWSIPSHHDYPADGKDRLAKTAAGVIGLKKDDFRSDNISDHEACGVIDPLNESLVTSGGRGKRVTIKGENDKILADIIVGKEVPDRAGLRFVRLPDQKRVYVSRADLDISTKFGDWIETDLLKVEKNNIKRIVLKDYSINERTLRVDQRDEIVLDKDGSDWKANKMRTDQEVDDSKMSDLLTGLDELKIVGVRPKPAGLSASLSKTEGGVAISQGDILSLQNKGFYLTRDGQLLSNEGELKALTTDGVQYTVRFGEIVYGSGLAVTSGDNGSDTGESGDKGPGENRYMFITTEFVDTEFPEPKQPKNTDFLNKADSLLTDADHDNKKLYDAHEEWRKKSEKGQNLSDELNARFASWYYVIASESYDKIHLKRKDLVKKKEEDAKS
jgi:hypothetical protein